MAIATLAWWIDPRTAWWYPPCPTYAWMNIYCLLCGSGRAVHALANLDLVSAFSHNALLVISVPFLVLWKLGRRAPPDPRWIVVIFLVALAWAVDRNLPEPFVAMAPPP